MNGLPNSPLTIAELWAMNAAVLPPSISASPALSRLAEGLFHAGVAGMFELMKSLDGMEDRDAVACLARLDAELRQYAADVAALARNRRH